MPYRIFEENAFFTYLKQLPPHPAGPAAVRHARARSSTPPTASPPSRTAWRVEEMFPMYQMLLDSGILKLDLVVTLPPGLRRRGRAIRRVPPGAPSEDRRNEGLSGRLSPGAHRLDAGAIRRGGGLPGIRHDGGRGPGGGHGAGLPAAHPAAVPLQWGRGGGAVPPLPGPGGTEAPRDGPAAAGDHPRAATGSPTSCPG